MNVIYLAQFHETCGYSHAAHGYLKSIAHVIKEHKGTNFKIISVSLDADAMKREKYEKKINPEILDLIEENHISSQEELNNILDGEYICLWHMTSVMPLIEKHVPSGASYHNGLDCNLEDLILGSIRNYHILAWETDKLCEEYKSVIDNYKPELVFAPSEWNRSSFAKMFKSIKIPHLIEENHSESLEIKLPENSNKFTILAISEWINRKNFEGMIRSYITEFQGQDDVLLILKTSIPPNMSRQGFIDHFSYIKNSIRIPANAKPNIAVIVDYLPNAKLKYLYEVCDAFCMTSFGEGFSLPSSEAAAIGKPIICPRHGGHTDFIDPNNKYFIEGIWDSAFDNAPYDFDGKWFKPTVNSTREKMRLAYSDWKAGTLPAEGQKNKKAIDEGEFNRADIGSKIIQNIRAVSKDQSKLSSLKRKMRNRTLASQIDILRDKYAGKECYILNCGPSLLENDPEKLKNFLKDKLTFTVKQAFETFKEVSDFHFFNCSNLPNKKTPFSPHYENLQDTIMVSSSNYDQYLRWNIMQTSDIFFKIPVRTEIDNEFLVRTGEIDKYLLKNNLTRPCGPGIMYETVLFMAIHLGVKSIKVLGWDLTMDKVTEKEYKHFYGSTDNLVNRGDILDWEIEETRSFSETFYNWCTQNGISLSLISNQSSLFPGIPRTKLEL